MGTKLFNGLVEGDECAGLFCAGEGGEGVEWSGCAEQRVLDIQGSGARWDGQATGLYFHRPTNQPSNDAKSQGLRNLAKGTLGPHLMTVVQCCMS